jgi:microcystin-dependent protein
MNTMSTRVHPVRTLARAAAALALALAAGTALAQTGGSTIQMLREEVAKLRAETRAALAVPVGGIVAYGGVIDDRKRQSLLAQGWMPCDGAVLRRTDYPDLYDAIGTAFGGSKDATSFRLPDLRGRFLRGNDGGAGNDPEAKSRVASAEGGHVGDNVGSKQDDALRAHLHSIYTRHVARAGGTSAGDPIAVSGWADADGTAVAWKQTENSVGAETRPKNIGVHWLIRVLLTLPPSR